MPQYTASKASQTSGSTRFLLVRFNLLHGLIQQKGAIIRTDSVLGFSAELVFLNH